MSLAESIAQLKQESGPEQDVARRRFEHYIERQGLKHTRQRELVLEVFLGTTGHLTVQELTERVRQFESNVGLTTVYRTLRLLVDSAVAEERHFTDGQARYEVAELGAHHDHLICTTCGKIFEFEDDEIEARQSRVAADHGLKILHHRHEIYAECTTPDRCSHRKAMEAEGSL